MRLLLTGANGFLGSTIARCASTREVEVVGLIRPGSELGLFPGELRAERGDFADADDAERVLRAVRPDVVVHCAAVVSSGTPDLKLSWRVNVEGTETLARAARKRGCLRFILISSMSAHPANKAVYGATKLASEEAARSASIPLTILRPSLIYGPDRRGIFYKMARLVQKLPIVPLVGGGREPMRPVHAEDVAGAILNSLDVDWSLGKTYELGGPEDWTFRDMIVAMRCALGKPPLTVPLPLPLCRIGAAVSEAILPHPPLTTDNLEGIANARPVDIAPAQEDLGFAPRSFEQGFRECLNAGLL